MKSGDRGSERRGHDIVSQILRRAGTAQFAQADLGLAQMRGGSDNCDNISVNRYLQTTGGRTGKSGWPAYVRGRSSVRLRNAKTKSRSCGLAHSPEPGHCLGPRASLAVLMTFRASIRPRGVPLPGQVAHSAFGINLGLGRRALR